MTKSNAVLRTVVMLAGCMGFGCGGDTTTDDDAARDADAGNTPAPACEVMVNDKGCDRDKRPIVFVHGNSSAGDSFSHPAQLFASNGYCALRIRAIDYDAITRDDAAAFAAVEKKLTATIAELQELSGAAKVDLFAHSQGAAYAARFATAHPELIAHYVHLAGGQLSSNPGGVPTLCLSSTGDRPVDCNTTKNVTFADDKLDHFAVCSSRESFREMYAFLNDGKQPKYDSVQCGEPIVIEGRALSFGDNEAMAGGTIEVHALGSDPWQRAAPSTTFNVREDGSIGPWTVQRGVAYEFKMVAKSGDGRPTRYAYLAPFKRSDRLLRFTFDSNNTAASAGSRMANLTDGTAALLIRRKQGAFLNGRDALTIDGYAALNDKDAMARATVTGLYVLDQDGDKRSSGGSVLRETFLNGTDVYLQTERPAFIDVAWGNEHIRVPNWPSKSRGISIVWVD